MMNIYFIIIYLFGCYFSYEYLQHTCVKFLGINIPYYNWKTLAIILGSFIGIIAIFLTTILYQNLNKK